MPRQIVVGLLFLLISVFSAGQARKARSTPQRNERAEHHVKIVRPKIASSSEQDFVCVSPYELSKCRAHIELLQVILHRYKAEKLGRWTWVLVLSADWKYFVTQIYVDPNNVAFSNLQMRQTFVEEVLIGPKSEPKRQIELLGKWNIPFDHFLDVAVSHELGHAFCHQSDEIRAEQAARRLRKGDPASDACLPDHQWHEAAEAYTPSPG